MMRQLHKGISWLHYVVRGRCYPTRWQDRLWSGHWSRGPVTVYGANAMHWAVNVWMLGHYWCFHPTTHTFGSNWPWYFYISKNATPWGACYLRRGTHKKMRATKEER